MQRAERFTPIMTFVNESLPSYPGLTERLRPFFSLSYPVPTPPHPDSFSQWQHYGIGRLDVCFVIAWVVIFSFLREASMSCVLGPLARRLLYDERRPPRPLEGPQKNGAPNGASNANGHVAEHVKPQARRSSFHRSKREMRIRERAVTRFSEQGFSFFYYTIYWAIGMYIHSHSPVAPFRPKYFWIGYPHQPLSAPVKFYYLTQLAEWMHQLVILNVEARRKDHWQMMTHHFITICLIVSSYLTNFTRVGCTILVLMDLCDALMPLAKMLRYLGFATACDAAFVMFLVSWLVTRHILLDLIIYSLYRDIPEIIGFRWVPSRGRYMTRTSYVAFLTLLISLQVIMLVWFGMICRVALGVALGRGAEDTRSDDEGEEVTETNSDEVTMPIERRKDR